MMLILLPIHILAGIFALLSSALAVCSGKGKRIHVLSDSTYFWSMLVIFLTAIPMSIITSNIFLFLIAIFSFYQAFAGTRFARNRKGIATIKVIRIKQQRGKKDSERPNQYDGWHDCCDYGCFSG